MNRLAYSLKQAFVQVRRNKAMSLASAFAITAMLLILGLFFVITVNINLFTEMVKQDYDKVEIFLKDDVSQDQVDVLSDDLRSHGNVLDVEYRSKEDAMNILKKRWGDNAYLLDTLEGNPLPNSLLVQVEDLTNAKDVTSYATTIDEVEDVKFYQDTVDKLTKITRFLQMAGLIIMAFLIVVSVVVVSNTIKLTVLNRAREISIMKYVGATNWFIRGPFLLEGILIGLVSSGVSAILTYGIYSKITDVIGTQVITMLSTPLVPASYLAGNLFLIFIAIGVSIGASGSIISMRKFLDK